MAELNTMKDNVNNQLANKADMADLSTKRDISDATFSNNIVVNNGEWGNIEIKTSNGKYMQIEVSPDKDNRMGMLMRKNSNGETEAALNIPMRTGTLATTDQIPKGVVDESTSGSGFWREWSDGWLEQGGFVASSGRDTQLTYNRPFRSEPTINVIARAHDGTYLSGSQSNAQVSYIGNTGCRISMYDANNLQGYCWQAWGWKAE